MIFKYPPQYPSSSQIGKYLQLDLFSWLRNLGNGLLKLSFNDNFDSFKVEKLSIANGETIKISNGFKSRLRGAIPNQRIITKQTGNGHVTDGTWGEDFIEIVNNGPDDTVLDIVYLWDGTNNSKFPISTGV